MLLGIRAVFRHKERPQCFGRRIADESIRNASAIFLLYLLLFLTGGILICCIDGVPLMAALFEAASAIGTVGLSLGITPELSGASRLIPDFFDVFRACGRPDHDLCGHGQRRTGAVPIPPGAGHHRMRSERNKS